MMIGVGGNAVIFRSPSRERKRDLKDKTTDLKSELNADLNKLSTDLKELMTEFKTNIRTLCDSTRADLKNANAVESREVSAERKMQGRLLRAIINLKNSEL